MSKTGTYRDTLPALLRDHDKRIGRLERRRLLAGGGGGTGGDVNEVQIGPTQPTDPNVVLWFNTTNDTLYALDNGQWVVAGGGAGAQVDEVYVGVNQPPDPTGVAPTLELWYDPDATQTLNYAFAFTQAVASNVWVIDHPLQFQPNVTAVDSTGEQIEGEVDYTSPTRVTITYAVPVSGKAYLS